MSEDTAVYDDGVDEVAEDGEETTTQQQPAPAATDDGSGGADEQQPGEGEQKEDDADWAPEFDERTQKFIDERIVSPKMARIQKTQRELEETKRQLAEVQSRLPQEPDQPPVIPPMPDPWADDYEAKLKDRDEAVRKHTQWEINQQIQQQVAEQQQQAKHVEQAKALQDRTATYSKRAADLGVTSQELQLAGQAVGGSGLDWNLVNYILEHENGPLITVHLAENLATLEDLRQMTPMRAAAYIEKTVAPKAARRKKADPPPPPTMGVKGGAPGQKDPALKGAKFE